MIETVPYPVVELISDRTIPECMQRLDQLLQLPGGSHRMTIATAGGFVAVHEVADQRTVSAHRPTAETGWYHNFLMPPSMLVEFTPTAETLPVLTISGGRGALPEVINNWLALLIQDVENIVGRANE